MMFKNRLMTPGPTEVPPSVLAIGGSPLMHHRTPQFRKILTEAVAGLKRIFFTQNDLLVFPAAGTGAMESAIVNLTSPGDTVLVASSGHFGNRWADIAKVYGVTCEHYEVEWGKSVDSREIARRLEANSAISFVFTTLSETSTGVENDIASIGAVTHEHGALLVVDAISGLGAIPFKTDAWQVDVAVAGSQKGLMIPPGLGLVTISPRAWERVKKSTHPKYYFSWEKAQKSMVAEELADTPYTPNISLILQISEAIRLIEKEGLEKVWERHKKMASATRAGLQGLGVKLYASDQPSNAVTSAWVPEGVDGGKMVKSIRDTYGITLAGGQGKAKGKIFRVGHLGYADDWDVVATIAAIERALQDQNFSFTLGQGVAAAEKVLFQK